MRGRAAARGGRGRVLLWLVAAALALPLARGLEDRLVPASAAFSSESTTVVERLARAFESPFASPAVLVLQGLPPGDTEPGRAAVRRVMAALDSSGLVHRHVSPATTTDTLLVGSRRGTPIAVIGLTADLDAGAAIDSLRILTERVEAEYSAETAFLWTGEAALNRDLRRHGTAEARRAELRAVPIAALVAWWAFGGLSAAVLAAVCGALAALVALGVVGLLAAFVPLTLLAQNMVSLLAVALGTDYALYLIWRSAEPSAVSGGGRVASRRTIALAGAAVAAGLAPLVVVPVTEVRSVGIAAIATVGVAVLVALSLIPAAARFVSGPAPPPRSTGRWPRARRREASRERWTQHARRVTSRPWLWSLMALLPLSALSSQALRLRPVVQSMAWLPPEMESARALRVLEDEGRRGVAMSLRVIADLPGRPIFEPAGWTAIERLSSHLEADVRVAAVRTIRTAAGGLPSRVARAVLPAEVRRSFVSAGEDATILEAAPAEWATPDEVAALVRDLRTLDVEAITGVPGARLQVGGLPAFNLDYASAINRSIPAAATAAVVASLIVILVGFRSPAIAIKAVLLNAIPVVAALGAAVLVFQDGIGPLTALGGLFPTVLLIAFCAVFGVSMDYEVFLVGRIAEARLAGFSDREAIAEGVGQSAAVITGAAAVMVSVFLAFTASGLAPMRLLGFLLAVAIALDATLIRLVLAPAALAIAGRWNWWPCNRHTMGTKEVRPWDP